MSNEPGRRCRKHHDDKGIVWPLAIAPFHVAIVPLNADNDEVMGAANILYEELTGGGIDVILDDRDARAGVKFADVELIGIPVRVGIGKRGIANRSGRSNPATQTAKPPKCR